MKKNPFKKSKVSKKYSPYNKRRGANAINFCISATGSNVSLIQKIDQLIDSGLLKSSRSNLLLLAIRMIYGDLHYDGIIEYIMYKYTSGMLATPSGCDSFSDIYEYEIKIHGFNGLLSYWDINTAQLWSLTLFHFNNIKLIPDSSKI